LEIDPYWFASFEQGDTQHHDVIRKEVVDFGRYEIDLKTGSSISTDHLGIGIIILTKTVGSGKSFNLKQVTQS